MKNACTGLLSLLIFVPAVFAESDARNLKQVAVAMIGYEVNHDGQYPPAFIAGLGGKPLLSWRVAILPYLGDEGKALYDQFKLDEPWDSPHNKSLLAKMPEVYAPVGRNAKEPHSTFYRVFVGKGTAFEGPQKVRWEGITDGANRTIMVVEASEPVPWSKPEDLPYDPKGPLPKLGSQSLAAFCDGSVRVVPKDQAENQLRAAITRNAGDDVDSQGQAERPSRDR